MGGKLDSSVVEHRTDYLIATKVGSAMYRAAARHNIPILKPSWIHEIWKSGTKISLEPFLLPPFAGCILSVTGLSASTRNEIQRLTSAYGGEYTPNLTKRCTHLLSRVPSGIKYRYALEWGIHCISLAWFFDSVNRHVCLNERDFELELTDATRQALFDPLAGNLRDLNRLSPALLKKHLHQMTSHRR